MMNDLKQKAKELMNGIDTQGSEGFVKYIESEFQINEKMKVVESLGLDSGAPATCLDISTCFGWLPWILREYGHEVFYTDNLNERSTLQIEARKRLSLCDCVHFQYQRQPLSKRIYDNEWIFSSLPEFDVKFDVITAVAVQPHSHFQPELWFSFLYDAMSRLNDGGVLYIAPNNSHGKKVLQDVLEMSGFKHEVIHNGWRVSK